MGFSNNTRNDDADEQLTIFYDGSCKVCSTEIGLYRKISRPGSLEFVDASDLYFTGDDRGIDRDSALNLLQARSSNGKLYSGVEAFTQIWSRTPRLAWLAKIANTRLFRRVLTFGYRLFLTWRGDAVTKANFRQLPGELRSELMLLRKMLLRHERSLLAACSGHNDEQMRSALKVAVISSRKYRCKLEALLPRKNNYLAQYFSPLVRLAGRLNELSEEALLDRMIAVRHRASRAIKVLDELNETTTKSRELPGYLSHLNVLLKDLSRPH